MKLIKTVDVNGAPFWFDGDNVGMIFKEGNGCAMYFKQPLIMPSVSHAPNTINVPLHKLVVPFSAEEMATRLGWESDYQPSESYQPRGFR